MEHSGLYWLFVAMEHLGMDRTPYRLVLRSVCKTCRRRWPEGSPLHLSVMDRFAEEWTGDGNLALLKWFYGDRGEMIPERLPDVAARHGRIDVLEWLVTMDVHPLEEACAEAAKYGRLGTLAWLRARGTSWDHRTTQNAESAGNLDVLDYAVKNGCLWTPKTYELSDNPSWNIVAYALENGYMMKEDACVWAARFNRFEDLKRFVESGLPLTANTFVAAARYGTEETILWLRDAGCPPDDVASYRQLVFRGDFAFLKRTVGLLGLQADATVLHAAAETGRDDVFWWIKNRDHLPWRWTIASAIAYAGNLRLLKEVVAMGCPVHENIPDHACMGGQLPVMQWLVAAGLPSQTSDTLLHAARRGDIGIIRWLRDRGCPWIPLAYEQGARLHRFEALEWMVEHGCPCYVGTIPPVWTCLPGC